MIDRAVGEATAHRQAGVPSTDNDCGDCANGARSQSSAVIACAGSIYYHRNIRGIGHDVVDCRSFLRLRDESLNIFALCISVYLVGYLDAAEAIADVLIYAENASGVHVPFYRRDDRTQLNVAVLGDRGDSSGQTTRQPNQDVLDRRSTFVLGGENLGVVGIEGKYFLVMLFLS